jgi:hypothetical protein
MASFTDTQPPKFNPYIQQQPVEAMVSVGMQKQKAYEEGVQKIQTQVDNIAGLDVIRDVDKAYLQSKLNQLGNNLRTVASGDFSNFQLVNSVSGMTKQLIRDEGIQNAVSSTAKLRKEQTFMEEERKKGELNPANEYVFNKQVSSWMDNSDVNAGLNAKYNKFFDVDKHMADTFDKIKPDGYTIDQIFVTGNDGKPLINKRTGQPELSHSMKKLKKEGKFPEKVKQTIDYVFSDPRVSKQLGINGQYTYRGLDSAALLERTGKVKTEQINNIEDNISSLNIQKSATTNKAEQDVYQAQIDKLNETKAAVQSSYEDIQEAAVSNPDSIRALLARDDAKNKFTAMYTNVITEETIHDNPAFKMEFEIQKERNDMAIKKEDMRYKWAGLAQQKELAIRKEGSDYRIAMLKAKKEEEEASSAGLTEGPLDTDRDYNETFDKMGENAWKDYSTSVDQLLFGTGVLDPKVLADYKSRNKGVSDEVAMRAVVNATAKKRGMTPYLFRTKYAIEANTRLSENPQLDQTMKNLKGSVENAKKHFDIYNNAKIKIDAETPDVAELNNVKPITLNMSTGMAPFGSPKKVTLTPAMQYDLSLVFNDTKSMFSTDQEVEASEAAMKRLKAKGITEQMVRAFPAAFRYGTGTPPGVNPQEWEKAKNFMYNDANKNFAASYQTRAAKIKEMAILNPVVRQPLASGETKIDTQRKETLSGYVGAYANEGQNESPGLVKNAAAMQAILKDDKKGTVQYTATRDEVTNQITPKALFYSTNGSLVGEVTLSERQAASIGFNPGKGYQDMVVKELDNKMYVTSNNTTAFGDVKDISTYQMNDVAFTKQDFPSLKGTPYDVKGNVKKSTIVDRGGVSREIFTNYVYVNDGKGKPVLIELPKNANSMVEAVNMFSNLTPDVINAIIKTK